MKNSKHSILLFVAIVTIAFRWAYFVGIYLHQHDKPIRILDNGKMYLFASEADA